jgi:hypothetical protein
MIKEGAVQALQAAVVCIWLCIQLAALISLSFAVSKSTGRLLGHQSNNQGLNLGESTLTHLSAAACL